MVNQIQTSLLCAQYLQYLLQVCTEQTTLYLQHTRFMRISTLEPIPPFFVKLLLFFLYLTMCKCMHCFPFKSRKIQKSIILVPEVVAHISTTYLCTQTKLVCAYWSQVHREITAQSSTVNSMTEALRHFFQQSAKDLFPCFLS